MKPLSLWAFCCLLFVTTRAQSDSLNQAFIYQRCDEKFISIPVNNNKKEITRRFEVVDARPDTSRLGFWGDGRNNRAEILLFRKVNLSKAIAAYMNAADDAGPGAARMLVVIKKLWLYDTTNSKWPGAPPPDVDKGRIILRLEAFMRTGEGLMPFTYLDTVVVARSSVLNLAKQDLADLLHVFMDKIAAVDEAAVLKRHRVFSMANIDSINNLRYAYPMDTTTVFRKGVYATVDEFRNNAPSVLDYTIEKDGGYHQLYLKDQEGRTYLTRKVWGYCDGQQCYAMINASLYPIITVGHSFYVWGAKKIEGKSFPVPIFLPFPGTGAFMYGAMPVGVPSLDRKMRFFSLDVQTGHIY